MITLYLNSANEVVASRVVETVMMSQTHRRSAEYMRDCAKAHRGRELMAYSAGCVIMSWSYVEAAMNEFVAFYAQRASEPRDEWRREVLAALATGALKPSDDSRGVLGQVNVYLKWAGAKELASGASPMQEAELVRQLRNALVHPFPESYVHQDSSPKAVHTERHPIILSLETSLSLTQGARFPYDVLTAECAVWAFEACDALVKEFYSRVRCTPSASGDKAQGGH